MMVHVVPRSSKADFGVTCLCTDHSFTNNRSLMKNNCSGIAIRLPKSASEHCSKYSIWSLHKFR